MKTFSIIIITLALSGCSLFNNKIEDKRPDPVIIENRVYLAYECPAPPQIDNTEMRDIAWDVASRKELDALILELLEEIGYVEEEDIFIVNQAVGDFFFHPGDEVRWSLSADDYADSGRNTSNVELALRQLRTVVKHYQKCIDDSKDAARRANEQASTEVSQE